ncbi:MAG: PKD domain-containing protein [Thermoplasmata archaeon]
MTSLAVIVIVLVLVGTATYGIMGGFSNQTNPTSCWPPNSAVCGSLINLHDVNVLIPFKSIQQGASVPFTASLPSGEAGTSFTFTWGDGNTTAKTANQTTHHAYTTPGTFLVEVQATVNGLVHDNLPAIQQVQVTPAYQASSGGQAPSVLGRILANTTTAIGTGSPTGVLSTGESVTVSASYSAAPTNALFIPQIPKIVLDTTTGGTVTSSNPTNTSAQATASFTTAGTYTLTFIGSATDGTTVAYQNYSWSVLVAPQGTHAGIANQVTPRSPHPGVIVDYELAPGGALSEDPAIDYETLGYEPILNVYQTLITYNGSQTGPTWQSFVPELATCVPGSPQCQALYGGNSLITNGTDYTFVINANASFYDHATNVHWGVYPTDVVFSIARTLGFSTLPCVGCNNGWIIGQALLDHGNSTWSTIHGPYNNTPQQILNSMSINDTAGGCPSVALTQAHGCVTFHADGNGHPWPYFLELIADPLGGSVVSCAWFSATAQGAGIPYWTSGNVTDSGDHPCGAPGSVGYGVSVGQMPFDGWDHWEELGSGAFGTYLGHVQWSMLGSGPYYVDQYAVGTAYTLKANPSYGSNPYCTWKECQPPASSYANTVEVTWEITATPGEQAYISGTADHASIPSTDLGLLLQLISQGKVGAVNAPTLTIGFEPFDMQFSLGGAQKFTTAPITVQPDFFTYVGMRHFFALSYPYTTIQNTINTRDGIQLSFPYGGAIPQYMANYYPTDIAWPNSDPCSNSSNSACPDYWWAQMHDRLGPYYDPEVAGCTSANPCQLPLFGATSNPAGDQANALWASALATHSGGGVKIAVTDINFVQTVVNSEFSGPGQNPMPIYGLGWAPDYPDPTDYVTPLYAPNGTYTYGDSVIQSLYQTQFTSGCSGHGVTDYNYYANTTFGQDCQGTAYKAMLFALNLSASAPAGPERVLIYDLADKIANQLVLYVYSGQGNQISSFAAWIDSTSINTNVTIGGGGDTPFFWLTGNSLQYAGST